MENPLERIIQVLEDDVELNRDKLKKKMLEEVENASTYLAGQNIATTVLIAVLYDELEKMFPSRFEKRYFDFSKRFSEIKTDSIDPFAAEGIKDVMEFFESLRYPPAEVVS